MVQPDVTQLLQAASAGDKEAQHQLAPVVYAELKQLADALMRRERDAHTVQATALVSDAFMRLIDQARVDWDSRAHFYALASRVMRQVLVEHARARRAHKRGAGATHLSFDEVLTLSVGEEDDVLRVEEALQALAAIDPRQADIVTMRFFGGLSMTEVAEALGVSKRTADREWVLIKAWLRRELAR
jgi:RNA polymerase sigma factor (TIGR02999 family)